MTDVTEVIDEFDKAFEIAAVHDDKTPLPTDDVKPVEEPAKKPEENAAQPTPEEKAAQEKADAEAAAAEALKNETPEAKAEREKAEAEAKAQADAAAAAKLVTDAAAVTLAEAEARRKAKETADAEAARKAAETETPEAKAAREEFEATIAPYNFTPEEQAALEKMKTDFPGEYAVMEARMKQQDRAINAKVHDAVQSTLQKVYKDLVPIAQQSQELALQNHLKMIHEAHKDFDTVVTKIPDWIKTQPAFLQPTLQAVYNEGTTQEVIDLVASYKAATTVKTEPKTAAQIAEETAAQTAKDAAAAKAAKDAAALLPVSGKRTTPSPKGAPDMNDFDGAFEEAAKSIAGVK